jgi:methylmalonyl-CoA carboxyltransferase small subunit
LKLQITVEGKVYEVDVEMAEEEEAPPAPRAPLRRPKAPPLNKQTYPIPISADPKVCRSPVTGLTLKVNVKPGQSVVAGEQMVLLESMNMETNVTALAAGRVKAVLVNGGDYVKMNQPLVEFE